MRRSVPTVVLLTGALVLFAVFVWLAVASVRGAVLPAWDRGVTEAFAGWRTTGRTHLFWAATLVGDTPVLAVLSFSAVLLFFVWGRRAQAALVAGGLLIGWGISETAKAVGGRVRPTAGEALIGLPSSHSMPSGHALTTLVFFGVLVYIAWQAGRGGGARGRAPATRAEAGVFWPTVAAIAAAAAAVMIGVSRIYLGVHWLSDVIGGWCLGGAWLAVFLVMARSTAVGRAVAAAPGRGGTAGLLARRPPAPAWARALAIGIVVSLCVVAAILTAMGDPLLVHV